MPEQIPEQPQVQPEAHVCHKSSLPWVIVSIVLLLVVAAGAVAGYLYWPAPCDHEECEKCEECEIVVAEGAAGIPVVKNTSGSELISDLSQVTYIYSLNSADDDGIESCQMVADMANTAVGGQTLLTVEEVQDSIVFLDSFHGLVYDYMDSVDGSDELIGLLDNQIMTDYIDYYRELCFHDGVVYLVGSSGTHEMFVLTTDLNQDEVHWLVHQPISEVMDFSYNLVNAPELGVIFVKGYGDMGYLGWSGYYLDIDSGATDLIEHCAGYSEFDSDVFEFSCDREYIPVE